MEDSQYYLNSVGNALRVMDLLSTQKSMSITEIHKTLSLGKTSVFRLLYTLESGGYVDRLPDAQYRLSSKFIRYGNLVLERQNFIVAARPYLRGLCDRTNQSSHLVVFDAADGFVTFLFKEASKTGLQSASTIGTRMEAYRCGTGKMLLSSLDDDTLEDVISKYHFQSYTANTIISPDALRRELKRIREQGYSEDCEESEVGLSCLAAPIYDREGGMVAAISISGATSAINTHKEQKLSLLREAARRISAQLGH